MDSSEFAYTVTSSMQVINPLTAELTCAEVIRRSIRLQTATSSSLALPDQTIDHRTTSLTPLHAENYAVWYSSCPNGTTFISNPFTFSLNCNGISHIMSRFDVANDCSTITREIDVALASVLSKGRGVTEVKIWKISTKVFDIDTDSEKLLTERYCSVPADDDLPPPPAIKLLRYNFNGSTGCVICMEDYVEVSVVVKLPCEHDFHGVCINQWSQINQRCPLCRLQFSSSSSFSFFLWISDL
ncbi:PREDICTED: RING finger protein 141-like [Camelina sativa]|uniref:RING finger protein 141-like n=1 Tax=Camelina sativa TaxID=90675 RepID=A0ABM0T108_CAMSA|nr:PREDICTED: RING finger protein 141-like [Camelina sativa]